MGRYPPSTEEGWVEVSTGIFIFTKIGMRRRINQSTLILKLVV